MHRGRGVQRGRGRRGVQRGRQGQGRTEGEGEAGAYRGGGGKGDNKPPAIPLIVLYNIQPLSHNACRLYILSCLSNVFDQGSHKKVPQLMARPLIKGGGIRS